MLKRVCGRRALITRVGEQGGDKVLAILRDRRPDTVVEVVRALADLLHDVLVGLAVERWLARQKNVCDDATGPDVALLVVVLVEDFRCDIVRRAKLLVEVAVGIVDEGRAEINDLDLVVLLVLLEQDILRFQIAVHDVPLVAVVDAGEDLFHENGTVTLAKFAALEDLIEELAALADLGNEVVAFLILEELEHFDDVWVILKTHSVSLLVNQSRTGGFI